MSKLITTFDKTLYHSLYNLQSYSEKSLQNWISKYKLLLYPDYYCFLSGYNFVNDNGDKSAADLILIAKDFSEWIIIEVELASKQLTHTKYQLRVFTRVKLDVTTFSKHCQRKEPTFHKLYQKELEICLKKTPKILVIFDYEDAEKVNELKIQFPEIEVGFCELYQTPKHNGTILRVHGANNYISKESIYLKPNSVNKSLYDVSDPDFFRGIKSTKIDIIFTGKVGRLDLIRIGGRIKVKIDDHPFNHDAVLILDKAKSNQIFLKAVNPN